MKAGRKEEKEGYQERMEGKKEGRKEEDITPVLMKLSGKNGGGGDDRPINARNGIGQQ